MPAFALTVFIGAFLLFLVQPLIGKYILPWFGGGPGVWTTCMLFFQVVLLGGYAYAHGLTRRLAPRTQVLVHLGLLAAALALLPITPADGWKPSADANPAWRILALLTVNLGLPYFVLSATGPLLQEWFRRTAPGVSPYRLYALSNAGSLLALISYPFYFETNFSRLAQARLWSWSLAVYAAGLGLCAWRLWRQPGGAAAAGDTAGDGEAVAAPTAWQRTLWLVLPACASVLLLAVTNKICQDVAVIPFLWVLPLALYLLSFIVSFDSPRWYSRFWFTLLLVAALATTCYALVQDADLPIVLQVAILSATQFIGCMVCHGELYRLKPHPRRLTSFYLAIAAGGAAGGLFVALVAPAVFNHFYEFQLSLALVAALLLAVLWRNRDEFAAWRWQLLALLFALGSVYGLDGAIDQGVTWLAGRGVVSHPVAWRNWHATGRAGLHWPVWIAAGLLLAGLLLLRWRRRARPLNWPAITAGLMGVGLGALVVVLAWQAREVARDAVMRSRNFYGTLAVLEYDRRNAYAHCRLLMHGRIAHGLQFVDPDRARLITSYFGPRSGLGLAFRYFPRQQQRRIGLLGLGIGTIAAYGRPGDALRIYEIDPAVQRIAENPFSYLAGSSARVEVVLGDGRLSMEREPPQHFDFLIMDAFTSDAVPVHLLTGEAFAIYQRHLKPDGVILVNISNRYVNLRPVVENAARAFGFEAHHIDCADGKGDEDFDDYGDAEGGGAWWLYANSWMVLSRNGEFMSHPVLRAAASPPAPANDIPLWTDDYSSMFRVLQ